MLTYDISAIDHCRSLESFLRNLLPKAPASYVRKMVRSGHATVNGGTTDPDRMLQLGDRVAVKESGKIKELLSAQPPLLDILYEDDRVVVFNKRPGIPVHRAAEDGGINLVELAEKHLPAERSPNERVKGAPLKLRPVNRLDRGTSGGVILAKSSVAAGMFGRLVKEGGLGKLYLAIAEGDMPSEGIIDAPLDDKECLTRYELLATENGLSFLVVRPETGRLHQIRRHLAMLGHPVAGDRRYGGTPIAEYPGIGLHAFKTSLVHPESSKDLQITAPLPKELLQLLEGRFGNQYYPLLDKLPDLNLNP